MTIDDQLNAIPREHLVAMLKDHAWHSADRLEYGDRQGYSYDVDENTSLRAVFYLDEPLFKTQEEAILAHWKRHYDNRAIDHPNRNPEERLRRVRRLVIDKLEEVKNEIGGVIGYKLNLNSEETEQLCKELDR